MHELILWCGFLGAWLLVAGPVYQAVLELQAEQLESDRIRTLATQVPAPPPTSAWWWLLPPVRFHLEHRRRERYRRIILDAMTDDDYDSLTNYVSKATGWLYVGIGAFLIATKETYELVEGLDWPIGVFWALLVIMTGLAIGNSVARTAHTQRARATRSSAAAAT